MIVEGLVREFDLRMDLRVELERWLHDRCWRVCDLEAEADYRELLYPPGAEEKPTLYNLSTRPYELAALFSPLHCVCTGRLPC
jgi:hypothetical protein